MAKGKTLERINRCVNKLADMCRGKVYIQEHYISSRWHLVVHTM